MVDLALDDRTHRSRLATDWLDSAIWNSISPGPRQPSAVLESFSEASDLLSDMNKENKGLTGPNYGILQKVLLSMTSQSSL